MKTWFSALILGWASLSLLSAVWTAVSGGGPGWAIERLIASVSVSGTLIALTLGRRWWALGGVATALFAYVAEELDTGRPTTFASLIGVAILVASTAAFQADRRSALLSMSAFSIGCAVLIRNHPGLVESVLFLALPIAAVVPFTFWGLGNAMRRWRVAEGERDRMARQALQARERERLILARELHDVVAHELTIVAMQASLMRYTTDEREQAQARDAIERTARAALDELKRLMQVLRTSESLDEGAVPEDRSLPAIVEAMSSHLERLGRHVSVELAVGKLPRSVELAAGRVLREASTNIVKHSGTTANVEISVVQQADGLQLRISNDGIKPRGMARISSTRLGLPGLEERLSLLGGTFSASQEEDRWVLRAWVPLTSQPQSETPDGGLSADGAPGGGAPSATAAR